MSVYLILLIKFYECINIVIINRICNYFFQDKDFGKGGMVKSHINPNAEVSTTMKVYQRYSIDRAYLGETFFWGTFPKAGDFIQFKFVPPIVINSYVLLYQ